MKRVGETGRPASAAMAGPGGGFLVAARPVRLGRDAGRCWRWPAGSTMRCWIRSPGTAGATSCSATGRARSAGRRGRGAARAAGGAGRRRHLRFAAARDCRGGDRACARSVAVGAGSGDRLRTGGRSPPIVRGKGRCGRYRSGSRSPSPWCRCGLGRGGAASATDRNDRRALLLGPAATDLNVTRAGIARRGP